MLLLKIPSMAYFNTKSPKRAIFLICMENIMNKYIIMLYKMHQCNWKKNPHIFRDLCSYNKRWFHSDNILYSSFSERIISIWRASDKERPNYSFSKINILLKKKNIHLLLCFCVFIFCLCFVLYCFVLLFVPVSEQQQLLFISIYNNWIIVFMCNVCPYIYNL